MGSAMATAAEVDFWKDMCRRQTNHNNKIRNQRDEAIRQQLAAEDARKTAQAVADGLEWRVQELEKDNAKLRELVRDMLRWMPCPRPCSRCERYRYPEGCEFDIRRREMGIDQ